MATVIDQFPHCDQRILHGPEDGCEFCNRHPDWQALREAWGIAFTGHVPRGSLPACGRPMKETQPGYGPGVLCRQPQGHEEGGCRPYPADDILPCPADFARPPGSSADHRRWGGNKPTGASGDPSWPRETAASVMMYGDKGGRADWPLRERIARRIRRPLEERRMRKRGWRRENGWWRFP